VSQLHRRPRDSRINLSSNELMHSEAVPLLKAAFAAIDAGHLYRYPRFEEGAKALAFRLHCAQERLLMTPGTDAAIRAIVRQYARDAGSAGTILLQDPNYYAWEQAAAASNVDLERVPWHGPGDQGPSMLKAAAVRSRALVALSFPNGPIGGDMTIDELDALVATCSERSHRLVIDTCYAAFAPDLPPLLNRWGDRALVLQSLSKSHGLAGCRFGVMVGARPWIAEIAAERLEHAVSLPAMAMAHEMLDRTHGLQSIWADIARCRAESHDVLTQMGLHPIRSRGNFLTFHVGTAMRAAKLTESMSREGYRIKSFGGDAAFADCLRITIGETSMMGPALAALRRAVTNH
jgi:histidinol-phosphate/aromatic aminotransferase/cobyric acid decarboxylase-like protein